MPDDSVRLRVTTASIITEEVPEFLGLPGASIFLVLGTFTGLQVLTHRMWIGLIAALAIFVILRYWLRGKPSHFFTYWIWEQRAPTKYRHSADTTALRSW